MRGSEMTKKSTYSHQLFSHHKILKLEEIKLQLSKLMHKYKDKHNIGQNYSVKLSDHQSASP